MFLKTLTFLTIRIEYDEKQKIGQRRNVESLISSMHCITVSVVRRRSLVALLELFELQAVDSLALLSLSRDGYGICLLLITYLSLFSDIIVASNAPLQKKLFFFQFLFLFCSQYIWDKCIEKF